MNSALTHLLLALLSSCTPLSVQIRIHSVLTGECLTSLTGHGARVRGLDCISMPSSSSSGAALAYFLGSASTDGQTHLWDLSSLARSAASAAPEAPCAPAAAFRPICSSAHDQRVVMLKLLPQWRVRKDNNELLVPVQTKAAELRQAQIMSKKQQRKPSPAAAAAAAPAGKSAAAATAAAAAPLSKSERAAAALAKSKAAFEKRTAALLKARRTLAKNSPHAAALAQGLDASEQQPKKKAKPSFEEAPLQESEDEAQDKGQPMHDEDDEEQEEEQQQRQAPAAEEDEEEEEKPAPRAKAAVKSKPAGKPAAKNPTASANSRPTLSAAQIAKNKSNSAAVGAATAGKAAAAAGGFSSALPLFKPKLNEMQRKKKKSQKKIQRDADRSRKQGGGR